MAKENGVPIPMWALAALIVSGLFNFLALATIVFWALKPSTAPVEISTDAAIGLHLQLLETMLAALAIGLALVGLFGFNTIRNAAMKAAQDAVESQMAAIQPPMVTGPSPAIPPIDPTGLKVEPEKQEL